MRSSVDAGRRLTLDEPRPECVNLIAEIFERPAVVDDMVGNREPLLAGHLVGDSIAGVGLGEPSVLDEPTNGFVGVDVDHHHGAVAGLARLDEEGHVVDHNVVGSCMGLEPTHHLGTHRRMNDRLQLPSGGFVAEHDSRDRGTIEPTVGCQDVGAEAIHHGVEHRCAWLLELPSDGIGIDDDSAMLAEHGGNRRLPRADATGEPDEEHGSERRGLWNLPGAARRRTQCRTATPRRQSTLVGLGEDGRALGDKRGRSVNHAVIGDRDGVGKLL